ncbi:hypothetical protein KW786_03845 [Candidatus Parcubacteria bacterium]|nr:hypothetical protein [Candidatus Parcubacteria bacterium]
MEIWYQVAWCGKEGVIDKGAAHPTLFGALGEAAEPQRNTEQVIRIEVRKLRYDKALCRFIPIEE